MSSSRIGTEGRGTHQDGVAYDASVLSERVKPEYSFEGRTLIKRA